MLGRGELPAGTVTFVFTDIEGSTPLMRRLGDRYAELLERHRILVRRALMSYGGAEVRCEGDGFFFAFPMAEGAIDGALAVQASLADEVWPEDAEVRVRIGMHVGSATPGPDGDYIALAVHEAARIAAAAHGGQTLASRAVVELAGRHAVARALGSFRLKGFDGAEEVYELRATGGAHRDERAASFPPPALLPAAGGNLPRPRTSFVGRRDELVAVTKQLETARLVTLVGPGGTGKTRLALEVARALEAPAYPDGRWFVDLAPLTSAAAVAPAVGDLLGLREVGGDPLAAVADALSRREALLVVDNAEHVVDGVAALVDRLLDEAAGVALLVTSREPLHVPGEAIVPLAPMEVPAVAPADDDGLGLGVAALLDVDAVRLFVDRAMAADPSFRFDDRTAPAIAAVCRAVDGLPLAVELAAARVRTLDPQQLAERLRARFTVLGRHPRPAAARQATLDALVDWSHELLSDDERVAFRRLAVFAGGFTVEAAERVIGAPPLRRSAVVDLLSSLVDRSLVLVDADPAVRRFRMLETIRAFASARLSEAGEASALAAAHAAWAVDLAETAAPHLLTPDQPAWLAVLEREWPNLRAALDHGEAEAPDLAARLAAALARFWLDRGAPDEGRQRVARAAAGATEPAVRGRLASTGARLALVQGDYTSAGLLAAEAEALARSAGDEGGVALALQAAAERALREGRPAEAAAGFEASLAQARSSSLPPSIEVVGLLGLAAAERDLGATDGAVGRFGHALDLAREVGDPPTLASALGYLGDALLAGGDADGARALFEEELALGRRVGHPYLTALALTDLANLAMGADDVATARRRYEEALEVARSIGDRQRVARCLDGLGMASMAEGDVDGARAQLLEAGRISRAVGYAGGIVNAEVGLARLCFTTGDLVGAHPHLLAALDATAGGSVRTAATLLEGLAQLHLAAGHPDRAARLLAATAVATGSDAAAEEFRPALLEALGEEGFAASWAAGTALSLAEAAALAASAP